MRKVVKSKFVLALLAVAAVFAIGCGSDTSETLSANLDSIQSEVFEPTCATSGCHSAADKAGSLDLSSATKSHANLVGVAAVGTKAVAEKLNRVESGNSGDSLLILQLETTDYGSKMPQGAAALPQDVIDIIKEWIDAGAAK